MSTLPMIFPPSSDDIGDRPTVCVLDDDELVLGSIKRRLETNGFVAVATTSPDERLPNI